VYHSQVRRVRKTAQTSAKAGPSAPAASAVRLIVWVDPGRELVQERDLRLADAGKGDREPLHLPPERLR
jgi:hypothetical protein